MKLSTPWMILLLVSVLANGVLLGFVLHRSADGPIWRTAESRSGPPHRGMRSDFDMRGFMMALPDEVRRETFNTLRGSVEAMRPQFDAVREARADVEQLLVAETFDPQATQAAMDRLHARRRAVERQIEVLVIERLGAVDAASRQAALDAGFSRHGEHHHGRPDGPARGHRDGLPPH